MQQLSLSVKCVTWIGCSNSGRSVTNELNASRFQRVDRGDPTVTQIHFKRLALGEADGQTLATETAHAMSLCWQSVKYHVDLVGQITSFCPSTYACVMERPVYRGRRVSLEPFRILSSHVSVKGSYDEYIELLLTLYNLTQSNYICKKKRRSSLVTFCVFGNYKFMIYNKLMSLF